MGEGISKQTPDLKILPRRDRTPRFEIPGSATDEYSSYFLSSVGSLHTNSKD